MRAIVLSLMAAPAVLAALSAGGCRPRARRKPADESVAGFASTLPPRVTRSDPKPPKPDDKPPPPPPPPAAGPRAAPKKDPLLSKKTPAPNEDAAPDDEPAADEAAWRARVSSAAAGLSPEERPDAGDQEGHPLTRRPDDSQVNPPGPPLHYLSPAPLRAQKTAKRSPGAADDAPDELDYDARSGGRARRPGRAPATGLALDDSLPEMGISDPNAIGSYHVQIASSPDFSRVLFDKIYPFMGDVDLQKDLAGAPPQLRRVWIRWAIVDLLEYEHPFTRPRRIELAPRRGD